MGSRAAYWKLRKTTRENDHERLQLSGAPSAALVRPAVSRLQRLDRALGCLLWKPLLFLLVLATAGSVWIAVNAFRDLDGTERILGVVVGLVVALMFGAGAFRVARKRGISEIEP